MIVVYTGDGKGKTSAALGQIVRALGHGMRVACAQFMKRNGVAGEQKYLADQLGEDLYIGGRGFLWDERDFAEHRQAALATLAWAVDKITEGVQVLVLDESLYALNLDVVTREELQALLDTVRAKDVHLILTGRGLPEWLRQEVDLVTEMLPVKHPFTLGGKALQGIDY